MSWTSSANSHRPRRSRGRGITGTPSRPSPVTCKPPPNRPGQPRRNHGNSLPTDPPSHGDPFPRTPGSAGITGTLPTPSPRHMGLRPTPPGHPSQPALRETPLSTPYNGLLTSVSTPSQRPVNTPERVSTLPTICQQPVGRPPGDVPRRAGDVVARRVPSCAVPVPRSGVSVHGGAVVQKCTSAHTDTRTFNFPFLFPS